MKVLALYRLDCGRMGEIVSLFVTTEAELKEAYGKQLYFGEVLGKHSEIEAEFSPKDIKMITDDQAFITAYQDIMGANECIGYSPLANIHDEDDED